MLDESIVHFLRGVPVGDAVSVRFATMDSSSERTWTGTIIRKDGPVTHVSYREDPRMVRLLPPDDDDVFVLGLSRCDTSSVCALLPPLAWSPLPLVQSPDHIIYWDGSAELSTVEDPPCVAAIVHVEVRSGMTSTHACWFRGGTNNAAEHLALLAALRLARTLGGFAAVLGDSLMVLKQAHQQCPVRNRRLQSLISEERGAMVGSLFITAHHIRRDYNRADAVCRMTAQNRKGCGDQSVFAHELLVTTEADGTRMLSDAVPASSRAGRAAATKAPVGSLPHERPVWAINSLEELRHLRTMPTALRVPLSAARFWAPLVSKSLSDILSQTDDAMRVKAFLQLLALPSLYLPKNKPSRALCHGLATGVPARTLRRYDRATREHNEDHMAQEAHVFCCAGELRKAAKVFFRTPLPPLDTPGAWEALSAKYPLTVDEEDEAELDMLATRMMGGEVAIIPPDVVASVAIKMSKFSASAFDRWNGSLFLAAAENDPTVYPKTAALLNNMLASTTLFETVRGLRGVALAKGAEDVRPIGIGSFWLRLLSAVALRIDSPSALPVWQKGVKTSRGVEKIIHRIRKAHEDGLFVLTTDVSNAFNSIRRSAILRFISGIPGASLLKRLLAMELRTPTQIHFQVGGADTWRTIVATCGTMQGDPASVYAFAGALAAAVQSDTINADIFEAIIDDVTIADRSLAAVLATFGAYARDIAAAGLLLQRRKCQLLLPAHYVLTAEMKETLDGLGIDIVAADRSIRVLGAHVGAEEGQREFVHAHLVETLDALKKVDGLCRLSPKSGLAVLRYCVWPKLYFRIATHRANITIEAARIFDEAIARTVMHMLGVMKEMVFAPEGVGFKSYLLLAHDIYADSVASTLPQNFAALTNSHQITNAQLGATPLTITPPPTNTMGWLVKAKLPAWSTTFEPNIASAADFLLAMQVRCGSFALPAGFKCQCHYSGENMVLHLLTCNKVKGCTAVYRHNCIVTALQRTIEDFGFLVSVEPRFYTYEDGRAKRPDLTVHITPTAVTTDVTVVLQPTEAATAKTAKHGKACEQLGHKFIPFVITIDGIHGESCAAFIHEISKGMPRSTKQLFFYTVLKATSDAWLIGTTAMIRGAVAAYLSGATDGLPAIYGEQSLRGLRT
jgi:ribonuclease HI